MLSRTLTYFRQTDWRIFFGIVITLIWIVSGILYLQASPLSNMSIRDIPMETVGNFLEGAFAPLAFLWLVIGLFIQQRELADNTEVLRQTSIQSEKQTIAIAATEMNARQGTFFSIAESVRRQLGNVSGMLFISGLGLSEGSPIPPEQMKDLWHRLSRGDAEVFAREFLILEPEPFGGYEALYYGTKIRTRHTKNFCDTYTRLLELAANCDTGTIIVDSLTHTAHGLLFNSMKQYAPAGMSEDTETVDASNYENLLDQTSP